MRFRLLAAAASMTMVIAAAPPAALQAQAATDPIRVMQCFIVPPRAFSTRAEGTQIDFVNTGPKAAKKIDFVVGYRNAASHFIRHVTDVGDFEPGALIQHSYPLYTDITYAGKAVHGCQAIAVTWVDGTRWSAL